MGNSRSREGEPEAKRDSGSGDESSLEPPGIVPAPEQDEQQDDLDEEDREPIITLDRYLSRRQPRSARWPQLLSMMFMLATLIAIIIYKDRCGNMISQVLGDLDPPEETTRPAVEYRLPEKKDKK